MDKVLCNIPHAGLEIPSWAISDFLICKQELLSLVDFMADLNMDRMFDFVAPENKVVSNVSRIVADMERFREDKDEPMAQLGMGLFYTKDPSGNTIRFNGTSYTHCLALYDDYHSQLSDAVSLRLQTFDRCTVLDCHSFHDQMLYTGFSPDSFPDVCIGFNTSEPTEAALWAKSLFEKNGFSVRFNMPFGGSLVPLQFWDDPRVDSLMIELNRRIYCNNEKDFEFCTMLCEQLYYHLNAA